MTVYERYQRPMAAGKYAAGKERVKVDKRLTYEKQDGEWGLKGHDWGQVPGELYGFFCKLHEYEKSGLQPDEVMELKERSTEREWILCSEELPPEPIGNADCLTVEELEQLIINHVVEEYIVTIYGGCKAAVLVYAGNSEWYDGVTQEYYKVVAWMQMPEAYKHDRVDDPAI